MTGTKTSAWTTTLNVVPHPRICTWIFEMLVMFTEGAKIRKAPNKTIPTMLLAIGAHISGAKEPRAFATCPSIVNRPRKKI